MTQKENAKELADNAKNLVDKEKLSLDDLLNQLERECQKMMKATKPEGTQNAYYRGKYCVVCEVREILNQKNENKNKEN